MTESNIAARNVLRRAGELANLAPGDLVGFEPLDAEDLNRLDHLLEALTTSLARYGFIPLREHFDPSDPEDASVDAAWPRGQFFEVNHPGGWYAMTDDGVTGPHKH